MEYSVVVVETLNGYEGHIVRGEPNLAKYGTSLACVERDLSLEEAQSLVDDMRTGRYNPFRVNDNMFDCLD